MPTITVREFEEKVLSKEEVVLIVRAPANQQVQDYEYERKAAGNSSITDWIEQRVRPCIGTLEFTIINGAYAHPHGRTKLETLRNGYEN
jgi:hypothetical protein